MATRDASITVKLDKNLKEQVENLASKDETSASVIVRKAIKFYVSKMSPVNKSAKAKAV